MNHKLYIIVGHYGSGKSEFSVNFAKYLNQQEKVCLADLDIVNPYFRSREVREELTQLGIDVLSDTLSSTKGLDMPYLSPAIQGRIALQNQLMILDCGGDDVGIRVLKQFTKEIINRDYEMWMIVNTYRPQTSNVSQIIEMKNKLETESELKITGYINNSNFLRQTTVEDLVNANNILGEVSEITQIPIKYVCGIKKIIEKLPNDVLGERFSLNLSLRNNWL